MCQVVLLFVWHDISQTAAMSKHLKTCDQLCYLALFEVYEQRNKEQTDHNERSSPTNHS